MMLIDVVLVHAIVVVDAHVVHAVHWLVKHAVG